MGDTDRQPALPEDRPASRRADAAVPPWAAITFDVPCPRCDARLNGITEPRCPQCGGALEWGEVLPTDYLTCRRCRYPLLGLNDPRCPECGHSFEWASTLRFARRCRAGLLEYLWFERPLDALGRTWPKAAFRPRKLWSVYGPPAEGSIAGLLVFALLQWVVFARGWQTIAWFADPLMNTLSAALNANLTFTYRFRVSPQFLPLMAVWHIATFLSLLAFFISNRRFEAGWRHILRVYVHATAFVALAPTLWCLLEILLDSSLFVLPSLNRLLSGAPAYAYVLLGRGVFLAALVVTWVHLWVGYRCHLRYPRGWGVGALAMMLGYCIALLVFEGKG